jgi:hypothetical protein
MLFSSIKRNVQRILFTSLLFILAACENEIVLPIKKSIANQQPIAITGDNIRVDSGKLVLLSGSRSDDTDGTVTDFLWQQTSGNPVVINTLNESDINFVAANLSKITTLKFRLTVIDNQGSTASSFIDVTITPASDNIYPFAHTQEDFSASNNSKVALSGVNSYDSDGEIRHYLWQQLSGTKVTIISPRNTEAYFITPDIDVTETLIFSLKVTDNAGASSEDKLAVALLPNTYEATPKIKPNPSRKKATDSNVFTSKTLNTNVTLTADNQITPQMNELVTFALPLAPGVVIDTSEINVALNGVKQAIFVKSGLMWHWQDNSIRSVTIQLQNVDMRHGDVTLSITNSGRETGNDLVEHEHIKGWTSAGVNKANMLYPRIFALHNTQYLSITGLIPPYSPAPAIDDNFEKYQLKQFSLWSGNLNFNKSSGANWLFDRATAYFKIYMTTGRVEFLKEAFISKQFYFSKVRNDASKPKKSGGRGCWQWKGVACADGKYIAPQQAKLAWALVGDNSQWDNSLINDMALQSDLGWNQYASRDPYNKENEGFTERGAGLTGLAEVAAFEITASKKTFRHINQRISSLADMQQIKKPWDIVNNWIPKSGGFEHSYNVHEGNFNEKSAPINNPNDRAFSPWMSENISDFLWQSYWITKNNKIPDMLRKLGNAVEEYGFTTRFIGNKQYQLKSAFSKTKQTHTKSCNKSAKETDLLYFTSKWADDKTMVSNDFWPYYSDTHNIETVLVLATAYYFENDPQNQLKLASRIDKLIEGWAHVQCGRVFSNVHRLFNWQHRSNSIRTWQWIKQATNPNLISTPLLNSLPKKIAPTNSGKLVSKSPKKVTSFSSRLSFSDVTQKAINYGSKAHQPFWIGMPDVNNDGCLDLFVGTHNDNAGSSQMWLHNLINGQCGESFTYYPNSKGRYSQKGKGRITSRYVFTNITGKKNGLPDFFGVDGDGGNSVIYPLSKNITVGAPPIYTGEIVGCRGGKNKCSALDLNGDGSLEFIVSESAGSKKRRVYDPLTNKTLISKLSNKDQPGYNSQAYLIVDVDGDSWPDIVAGQSLGYWRYNPIIQNFDAFKFTFPGLKKDFSRSKRGVTNQMQVTLDYDNDGDFDILFGSGKWGPADKDKEFYLSLQRNNGDGTFTNVTEKAGGGSWTNGSLKNTTYWTTYAGIYPGDFDNDGYIDFMTMSQSYKNSPRLFKNNGDGTFTLIKNLIENGGAGVDVFRPWGNIADWNNDGFLDVAILSNGIGDVEGLRLYKNNTNKNHWLKLRARGLNKNTDGYHTKFIIKDSASKQILATRYLGNYNLTDTRFIAHAGLGDATLIDLVVEFPHDGPVYHYSNLTVDTELIVFRDGCLLTNWQPGKGWPITSNNQQCRIPD